MKPRIDGLRVVAFNLRPEHRLVQVARICAQRASPEYVKAMTFSIEAYFELKGEPIAPRKWSAAKGNGPS